MKTYLSVFLVAFLIVLFQPSLAQSDATVTTKGIGAQRDESLQDALRNAVSQAMGTYVQSETEVENFMVIRDAILTRSEGYVKSYEVVSEGMVNEIYEIKIKATVSLEPLKADAQTLAVALGGLRFLVMYDKRGKSEAEIMQLDYAAERINEYLSNRGYRYIEKSRFESLQREATNIYESENPGEMTYVQRLGMLADAQFIIHIKNIHSDKRSESFDTHTFTRTIIEVKAYDNCTAEGLGTVMLEGEWVQVSGDESISRASIAKTIENDYDKLQRVFNTYMGTWINNGTPFEVRFYGSGSFRDFRELRDKLKADKHFSGQMEITSVNGYTKLNCTFRTKPDDLAYTILDYSDEIPFFKEKTMDVKLIYGRQISFAPRNIEVKELQKP